MRRWSDLAERVAATTRTSEKTALLADYLRSLSPDELPVAAVFLTGRPFPEADQRTAGLGWSAIVTAVGDLVGVDPPGPRRGLRPALGPEPCRRGRAGRCRACPGPGDAPRRSPRWPPRSRRSRRPAARPARRPSCANCSRGRTRRRPRASSRSSAGSCASACARVSSRRPSPRPSTGRSTRSSGRAC